MNVLLVEDDAVSQRILAAYFTKWGYDFELVADGEAAWQLLEKQDFPIVVTDWLMPRLDGVELIRRIRSSRSRPGYTYVILLTGQSDKEHLVAAMDAGADDFLAKPFDRDELRVRVREGERVVQMERAMAADADALNVHLVDAITALDEVVVQISSSDAADRLAAVRQRLNQALALARKLGSGAPP
jgi:DNA-binding response OmpR family regulator